MGDRQLGIYVHIPFCARKCRYCDFLSFGADLFLGGRREASLLGAAPNQGLQRQTLSSDLAFLRQDAAQKDLSESSPSYSYKEALHDERFQKIQQDYLTSLLQEIDAFEGAERYELLSVYFGGGTPSFLDAEALMRVLEKIREKFVLPSSAEITVECNPGTLTDEKISAYRDHGVNRLSLGLQSSDPQLLHRLGRIHSYEEFQEEYRKVRRAGFSNVNVDLMYALPGQSRESWRKTLMEVVRLPNGDGSYGPEHLSAYSLIIEEGTPFWELYHEDNEAKIRGDRPLFLPDEETEAGMLSDLKEILALHGYQREEISNYARKGYESIHNNGYWLRREYAGFGLGAASLIGKYRYRNSNDLKDYLSGDHRRVDEERLSEREEIEETMFLGLRRMAGVDLARFRKTFGISAEDLYRETISMLERQGLIQIREGFLILTERGIEISNVVLAEFLLD